MPLLATSQVELIPLVELIPFSDLKTRANKYMLELWQSERDELPGNKLHEVFPVLKQCVVCPRTNRKEETDITHSFSLKDEEPPVCIGCEELLTIKHLLLTCSDLKSDRATLRLNRCMCCFRRFRLRRFLRTF